MRLLIMTMIASSMLASPLGAVQLDEIPPESDDGVFVDRH